MPNESRTAYRVSLGVREKARTFLSKIIQIYDKCKTPSDCANIGGGISRTVILLNSAAIRMSYFRKSTHALCAASRQIHSTTLIRASLALIVAAASFHPGPASAQESGAPPNSPPANADEILWNLRDIISHGNLGDETFYAKKLGVTVTLVSSGPRYGYGLMCGRMKIIGSARYFKYTNPPWYFDKRNLSSPCGYPYYPYAEEVLPNRVIQSWARIPIDIAKVCITLDQMTDHLIGMDYIHPYNQRLAYRFNGRSNIILVAAFTESSACISSIEIYQNFNID